METPTMRRVAIHWFRKGLRLHDNLALQHALDSAAAVYPLFILDPYFLTPERVGSNRMQFLLQCLEDLDANLRSKSSRLIVAMGKPLEVLPAVAKAWGVTTLTYEKDTEPFALARDAAVRAELSALGVEVHGIHGHTLYDMDSVKAACGGRVPTAYQSFLKLISGLQQPNRPIATHTSHFPTCPSEVVCPGVQLLVGVPSLRDLGFPDATTHFIGGETEGLRRLRAHLERKEWICKFSKPDTDPTSIEPDTTVLSPYLKFGAVSCREFYWGVLDAGHGQQKTQPPVSLLGQILWREFFYAHSYTVTNFDKMIGNKICKRIRWDNDKEMLKAWEEGRTGYPWIDAAMAQLRKEGWMHHLARHAVACFLTRGDLYQSWEAGAAVFDRLLLDADWALNNGNWMWLSASAFFHQYFRVYSPVAFAKKLDPNGNFIRKYLPQFDSFPAAYIYEPWKAPVHTQKAAGVVVGVNYPARIVIHEDVVKVNMARHAQAYGESKSMMVASSQSAATSDMRQFVVAPKPTVAGVKRKRAPVETDEVVWLEEPEP